MSQSGQDKAAQDAAIAAIKARIAALHAQRDRGEISAAMCKALTPRLERELLDAIAPAAPTGRWRRRAPALIRALVLVGLPCVLVVAWIWRGGQPASPTRATAPPAPSTPASVPSVWYPAMVAPAPPAPATPTTPARSASAP